MDGWRLIDYRGYKGVLPAETYLSILLEKIVF
jgi:hypothetical protein